MYLVCFFGIIGRSIRYTHSSHVRNILDVLKEHNIPYKVLVVNNDIEDNTIDGELIDNDDKKIIRADYHVEIKQTEIDEVIFKEYPMYWDIFEKKPPYSSQKTCLNALRQSYIEKCVSSHISNEYDKVIAISADFQLIHKIPIQDIISLNQNELMISDMNHAHGYTNGLYIGSSTCVKNTMNHFHDLQKGTKDYEQIIKMNTEKHHIDVISRHIIFAKIRANRDVFILRNKRLKQKIIDALDRDYPLNRTS